MRAVFMRKEPEIDTKEFQVEKVITLPSEQYAYFTQHLMKEHDFIKENVDLMYEKDGVWHCLLVAGEGMDEGVLVESEGSAYARYSAFVPFAQEIIRQYILRKNFSQEERRFLLKNLCEIFQISDLNEKKIVAALENNAFSDFEDGLQEECAVESMADYIVTRNPADFKHSRVKVILPDELLRELEKN